MNEKNDKKSEESQENDYQSQFIKSIRRLVLAGIGAVGVTVDEIEDVIERLVERGEIAEKDGTKLFKEVMEKKRSEGKSLEDFMSEKLKIFTDRMNLPTKEELDILSKKIDDLAKQIKEKKTN